MKKEKTPPIVSLAILTLITSILWIFFSLYRVFTQKSDIKVPGEIIQPLSPTLNETTISEIEKRVFIDQNQIPDSVVLIEEELVQNEEQIPDLEYAEEQTEENNINTDATESASSATLEEI